MGTVPIYDCQALPTGPAYAWPMRVTVLSGIAVVAIVVVALTLTITRGPEFHHYADARIWLGIPHAGDVLSNAAFIVAAVWFARDRWSAVRYARPVCVGVLAIVIGSGAYHVAPSDTLLALDWAPIVVTLGLLSAAVIEDRGGPGRIALIVAPVLALGSVAWWIVTGGTHGGNMAPYVAVQATGIVLPLVIALVAPGTVRVHWLFAGVVGFALARICAAHDHDLLDRISVSGHSLKHIAAAGAAACALRALMRR
jgi:hypothetical protein